MRTQVRLLAATVIMLACSSAAPHAKLQSPPAGEDATTRINPEVRLRKLHIVRPDLIPYPVYYEVYC